MKYPINYDFGKNWLTKIVPVLDNPKIIRSLKKLQKDFAKCMNNNSIINSDLSPAKLCFTDWYVTVMMRKDDLTVEKLRKEGKLTKEYLDIENKMNSLPDNDDQFDDLCEDLMDVQYDMLEEIHNWNNSKYYLESYLMGGGCHFMAPTFEIALAKLVEPTEKWRVQSSKKHSTVINETNTKIFDFLYWCCNGRINHYLFGDKCNNTKTLGGMRAYLDSLHD